MAKNPFSRRNDDQEDNISEEFLSDINDSEEKSSRTGLPSMGAAFGGLMDENDDESKALAQARREEQKRAGVAPGAAPTGSIEAMLEQNHKELRQKYPMGGIKTSRFITTDILLRAPDGYFDHHNDLIRQGVVTVQTALADSGRSDVIGQSQQNPTDETLQDAAYRVVHGLAVDFMDKFNYRSIERAYIISMISNEIIGFGPLDPLWRDRRVTEIICNGPHDIQVEISGRLLKVPGIKFRDQAHLLALIERLYQSVGKTLSRTSPIQNGSLHDRSRMEAVHTSVAPDGPNFNIRRHQEGYILPTNLIEWNSISQDMMEFLGNMVYRDASILVSGGTGSGKALTLDTPIPTPNGWSTMGDISVGDKIFDHRGNTGNVLRKFPQPARQVYAVTFNNGEVVHCDAEHNWFVTSRSNKFDIMTTVELLKDDTLYAVPTFNVETQTDTGLTDIVSIEAVEGRFEEMACITVDTPDSTYLVTKSFVTTHNTTLLNALTSYIRPAHRVVVLEDTIEMKVHPKKYAAASMGCLPARPDRPGDMGVTMRDLVKSSLRLRPNTIMVGEVRDGAAYDLCQALNTGHSGMSTVHANSPYEAIFRLVALVSQGGLLSGPQVLPSIGSAFDFIVQVERMPIDNTRKIVAISEVSPFPVLNEKTGELHLPTTPIWEFKTTGVEAGKVQGVWEQKNDVSPERKLRLKMGLEKDLNWDQLQALSKLD